MINIDIKIENFEAIYNNSYIKYILNSLKPKIRMSSEELEQVRAIALWKAIKNWDSNKSKFNTHLTNYLRYEILLWTTKEIRFIKKSIVKEHKKTNNLNEISFEFLDLLSEEEKQILNDKYLFKLKDCEIIKKLNISPIKFNRIKNALKKKILNAS